MKIAMGMNAYNIEAAAVTTTWVPYVDANSENINNR